MLVIMMIVAILVVLFLVYAYIPSCLNKKRFFKKRKSDSQAIYLTFDDGPSKYTEELLVLLEKYSIQATFFCVAIFAEKNKEIIEEMKNAGHLIALHSLKHKNAMLQGIFETKRDVEESLEIMNCLGVDIQYYRPPWGDCNLYLLRKLRDENIRPVWWHVMAEDWEAKTTETIIAQKLLERVKPGDIICLHDGRGKNEAPLKTIKALEIIIPQFLKKGYEFKKIDEYEF